MGSGREAPSVLPSSLLSNRRRRGKKKKKDWVKVLAQRVVVVVKLFMILGEENREWKKLRLTDEM